MLVKRVIWDDDETVDEAGFVEDAASTSSLGETTISSAGMFNQRKSSLIRVVGLEFSVCSQGSRNTDTYRTHDQGYEKCSHQPDG